MGREADANELHNLVSSIVRGGAPIPAGIFGPFGADRGIREELQQKVGIIAGKVKAGDLNQQDVESFLALCSVAEASGVMGTSDFDAVNTILERNK